MLTADFGLNGGVYPSWDNGHGRTRQPRRVSSKSWSSLQQAMRKKFGTQ